MIMKHYNRRVVSFFISIMMMITFVNTGVIHLQADTGDGKIINDMDIGKPMDGVEYEGKWASANDSQDQYHHDEHWSNNSDWTDGQEGSYTITFTGSSIQLFGNKSPKLGNFKVWIDDKLIGTYSATSTTRLTKQKIFESKPLTNTEHKLKVKGVYGTGNLQFDYALVQSDEPNVIGTCDLQANDIKKGKATQVKLQLKAMKDAPAYLAAEFYIAYDKDVLHYIDTASTDQNTIIKVKDEGGNLHIVVAMKKGLYNDFTITLTMSGIKVTKQTALKVTKATVSDATGKQGSLTLSDQNVAVVKDEQVEQAYQNLQDLITQTNTLLDNGALDHVDEVSAQLVRTALQNANTILHNQTSLLQEYVDAWNKLSDALHLLQSVDYKAKLKDLIKTYQELDLSIYEEAGVKQFQDVLKHANNISMQEDVSVNELIKTYNELLQAKDYLVEKKPEVADKTLLKTMLTIAEKAEKAADQYDQQNPSWNIFIEAIKRDESVLQDSFATQKDVDHAIEVLSDAYENIRLKPDEVTLAALRNFINQADSIQPAAYAKDDFNYIVKVKEQAKKLYQNFSEEGYQAIEKNILKAIDIMQNHKLSNKQKEQQVTVETKTAIDTGDNHDEIYLSSVILIVMSTSLMIYARKKRKKLKENTK